MNMGMLAATMASQTGMRRRGVAVATSAAGEVSVTVMGIPDQKMRDPEGTATRML
jgi:hypothetical protein